MPKLLKNQRKEINTLLTRLEELGPQADPSKFKTNLESVYALLNEYGAKPESDYYRRLSELEGRNNWQKLSMMILHYI